MRRPDGRCGARCLTPYRAAVLAEDGTRLSRPGGGVADESLAGESNQCIHATFRAADTTEAVCQDPAGKEAAQLANHEAGQIAQCGA